MKYLILALCLIATPSFAQATKDERWQAHLQSTYMSLKGQHDQQMKEQQDCVAETNRRMAEIEAAMSDYPQEVVSVVDNPVPVPVQANVEVNAEVNP